MITLSQILGLALAAVPQGLEPPFQGAVQHLDPFRAPIRKLADFDGDGRLDALTIDSETHAMGFQIHRGDGEGGFLMPDTLDVAPYTVTAALTEAGDFDGDGVVDLVLQLSLTGPGEWFLLRGRSTPGTLEFEDPLQFTDETLIHLRAIQYDDDPALELVGVWTQNFSAEFSVYHQLWEFDPSVGLSSVLLPLGLEVSSFEAVDINGDGYDDLVAGGTDLDPLRYYINGGGTFDPLQGGTSLTLHDSPVPDVIGDFTGDGYPDFLTFKLTGGSVQATLTRSTGPPGFGYVLESLPLPGVTAWELGGSNTWSRVNYTAADFNGDGHVDVGFQATGQSSASRQPAILFREGFGDGSFGPALVLPCAGRVPLFQSQIGGAGDLNGDGIVDFIGSHSSTRGLAGAVPGAPLDGLSALSEGYSWRPLRADLDGDGDLDRVDVVAGTVEWNDASGALGPGAEVAPLPIQSGGVAAATTADLDGDGRTEVLTLSVEEDLVLGWRSYEFGPDGGFADMGFIGPPVDVTDGPALVADLDGDGDSDLVYGDRVLHGDGAGGLEAPVDVFSAAESVVILDAADADLDGDVDLLTRVELAGAGVLARAYLAEASGLVPHDLVALERVERGTRWLDVDSDGDLDVVVGGAPADQDPQIAVFSLDQGQFSSGSILDLRLFSNVGSVAAEDLDRDGILDLLVSSSVFDGGLATQNVALHGLGGGAFAAASTLRLTWRGATFADLDQDGDLDSSGFLSVFSERVETPAAPQLLQYGEATPTGAPSLPLLGASGFFAPGSANASLRLVNAPPAALVFLATSADAGLALGIPGVGLTALIDPMNYSLVLLVTEGAPAGPPGSGSLSLPFVPAPSSAGAVVHAQAFIASTDTAQGLVASNGLRVVFGL